jgi:hypothetical protein
MQDSSIVFNWHVINGKTSANLFRMLEAIKTFNIT